jgi:cytoskeletal protein CcmA (bactofilin family)
MMFGNKKESISKEGFDTLIGTSTIFEGNIDSDGTVRIDGKVKGDINVKGDVFIGSEALITGNIYASSIHLSGSVEGNIHVTNVLRLLSTAKLCGDIQVRSFVADEGAVFQGNCSMIDAEAASGNSIVNLKNRHDYKKSAMLDEVVE